MSTLTPQERAAVAHASDAPMLAQVEAWAAINSGTGNLAGVRAMGALLADAFAILPGDVALVDAMPVAHIAPNGTTQSIIRAEHLVLRVRPNAAHRVLLTGHMDTVFAADHPFQTLTWRDANTLNGPGVADMKGGIAVMLAALRAIEHADTDLGYDVLINSDEETGSGASAALIASFAQNKLAALTYEPALPDGTLAGARPGSGNFSVIITGKAAHAGRNPRDGRNAVLAAADLALRLSAARSPTLSINPAKIDGGGPNNIVPDHAILRFNIRPATPEDERAAQPLIDNLVANVAKDHDVLVHVHGNFGRPPKPLTPEALRLFDLVQRAGADLGQSIAWRDTGGVCDGNNIAACGVPVVDTMGACGGAIHSADEFLLVDSLVPRAQLSAVTLLRIAARGTV
jgi:glutamate carboxypeptidase